MLFLREEEVLWWETVTLQGSKVNKSFLCVCSKTHRSEAGMDNERSASGLHGAVPQGLDRRKVSCDAPHNMETAWHGPR